MDDSPEQQLAPATTGRQKLLLVFFGLGLLALGLLLIEAILGWIGVGDPYRLEDPFVGFAAGRDLFELRDGRYVTRDDKLAFFNRQDFPAEKADGTFRVFALGGSTTAGRPYDDAIAFPKWLELFLAEADPNRRYEVINAGGISYASYRIAVLMKELVRYSPDLFVIYTGHNEFLEERTYRDIIHQPQALKKLRILSNRLRSVTLLRQALQPAEPSNSTESDESELTTEVQAKLDVWNGLDLFRRDDQQHDSIVQHFEYNLRQMLALADSHGIDTLLVRPVANLKDFSPFKSEADPQLPQAQLSTLNELVQNAQRRRGASASEPSGVSGTAGTPDDAAIADLEQALAIDPGHAESHYRLATALFDANLYDQAEDHFVAAKDTDVCPLRAPSAILAAIDRVAGETSTPIIDLRAQLRADSQERFGHSILGNTYLLDHVHPTIAVHRRIAEEILAQLIGSNTVPRSPTWGPDAKERVQRQVEAGLDNEYLARRDLNLAKVLGWAGKYNEAEGALERAAQVLDDGELNLNLGIVYQRRGRIEEARGRLERAVQLLPEEAQAHFNLGVVYGRQQRWQESADALERALALDSGYQDARFNLAMARRQLGDLDQAEALLTDLGDDWGDGRVAQERASLVLESGNAQAAIELLQVSSKLSARLLLAEVLIDEGRLDQAADELDQLLERHPESAAAHYHKGRLLSRQGQTSDAAAAYSTAIELQSSFVEAHNNLAILYAQDGELERARQHLTLALDLAPSYAEAHFNLGLVYANGGHPQEAEESIQRALELEPTNARFHSGLAALLEALGKTRSPNQQP